MITDIDTNDYIVIIKKLRDNIIYKRDIYFIN